MTESDLIEDEIKKASANIPESSSREKLNDSEIQILKNTEKLIEIYLKKKASKQWKRLKRDINR